MTMQYSLGAQRDKRDKRDFAYRSMFREIAVPTLVDYEDEMSRIKSQGARGSCVAFACCAIKEYQESRERRFRRAFDLSEEFLYRHIQLPGGGAYPRDAMKVLTKIGVPPEEMMPYNKRIKSDKEKLVHPTKRGNARMFGAARRYRAKGYVRLKTIDEVMQSLATNGPCLIGVGWLRGWSTARRIFRGHPILDLPAGSEIGGHAIAVIGYDRRHAVLKIRNSWGKQWGLGGYAFITFAAFESQAWDCWATFDKNSPLLK